MSDLVDWLLKNPSKAANEIEHLREWKEAIDNALICAHIGTADSFPDARTALNALCAWCEQIALDPAVSQDARALIDKGRAESAALADTMQRTIDEAARTLKSAHEVAAAFRDPSLLIDAAAAAGPACPDCKGTGRVPVQDPNYFRTTECSCGAGETRKRGRFKLTCDECGQPVHPQWPQAHKCKPCPNCCGAGYFGLATQCRPCSGTGIAHCVHDWSSQDGRFTCRKCGAAG